MARGKGRSGTGMASKEAFKEKWEAPLLQKRFTERDKPGERVTRGRERFRSHSLSLLLPSVLLSGLFPTIPSACSSTSLADSWTPLYPSSSVSTFLSSSVIVYLMDNSLFRKFPQSLISCHITYHIWSKYTVDSVGLTRISPTGYKVLFYPSLSRSAPGLVHTMQCSGDVCWSTGVKGRNSEPGCLG